jgi:hypothetical protein
MCRSLLASGRTAVYGSLVSPWGNRILDSAPTHKAAVTPRPGRYSGFVGPFSISFRVSSNSKQIMSLASTFNPAADCGVPTNLETEHFPKLAIRKGAFTGSDVFNPPSHILVFFSIRGSFSGRRQAGTITCSFASGT